MRIAHIKNGIVINTTLGDFLPPDSGEIIYREAINGAGIGWGYDGSTFIAPPQPEPEPLPDWAGFNTALLDDPDWVAIAPTLPEDLRYAIVSTAANGNAMGLQTAYLTLAHKLALQGQYISNEVKESWQTIANTHNIPVEF